MCIRDRFELGGELQVELVSVVQRSRADYLGKLADLLGASQRGEELSGELGVVLAGEPWSGAVAHQSRQRGQRVNGWVDAARMNVRRENDLAFSDIARRRRGDVDHCLGGAVPGRRRTRGCSG